MKMECWARVGPEGAAGCSALRLPWESGFSRLHPFLSQGAKQIAGLETSCKISQAQVANQQVRKETVHFHSHCVAILRPELPSAAAQQGSVNDYEVER